ncbi:MAG: PDC sensor domain-containing protein [Campylobacteraceae bacterium]|nr:PDC sensor domain-containing protein [Campylobacteraceae bacterium]
MTIRDIQRFSEIRYQARAYLCYLFTRNIHNHMPSPQLENILVQLDKIAHEVDNFEALYILDTKGDQIIDNISKNPKFVLGKGINRSNKAYYYRTVKEKRCVLTDPYPSSLTNGLSVTAGFPLYDDKGELCYVICIDISLEDILKISNTSRLDNFFGYFSKIIYTLFAIALFLVSSVVFFNGIENFLSSGFNLAVINIEEMFKATILLTLSLAIFDLVKTIFEEEVLGRSKKVKNGGVHKTMVRFLGSIVIALAIESLMLVFKFAAKEETANIIYAVYLLGGVTLLLIGLSLYLYLVNAKKKK